MIRLHKMMSADRGTHVEVETVEEAAKHFDREMKFIVVRCDLDEEAFGMERVILAKNEAAAKGATLISARAPSCVLWQQGANFAEGTGWRTVWVSKLVQGAPVAAPPPPPRH